MLSHQFFSYNGISYKRAPIGVHLKCVDKDEALQPIKAIHEGVCGPHMNEIVLPKKIARQEMP